MNGMEWRQVPVGLDAERWITRTGCKKVLVVVHSVTTGQRLLDVVRLLESDLRIQVVFTAAPDVFSNGVDDLLRELGCMVISWDQATQSVFDLALAAGYESINELHAPLIVLPHGAGHNKLVVRRSTGSTGSTGGTGGTGGAVVARGVSGLDPQNLIRGGSVVPTAIVLSHHADLAILGRQCPEALPVAVVVGDPCYDRMLTSQAHRAAYRRALRAGAARKLVLAVSTWGTRSLFGQAVELLDRMLTELPPDEYRVVSLVHPNVWFGHGLRQVRAWLTSSMDRGLGLVPPSSDWLGALVAADLIVGDHGSVAVYGAAARVPVLLAGFPSDDVSPASPSALLAASARRLDPDLPLTGQLADALANYRPEVSELVAGRLTSEPGRFNQNMRRLLYQVLGLPQPATIPCMPPAGVPALVPQIHP
jgi:hypothetical protein